MNLLKFYSYPIKSKPYLTFNIKRFFSNQSKSKKATNPSQTKTPLKTFNNVFYDETGRFLVLHHNGAAKYYKLNILFLFLFFGLSFRNYKYNPAIFLNETLGRLYLAIIGLGIWALLIFGNRHIKSIYLLPSGRDIVIETYQFFGLVTPRQNILDVSLLKGSRVFLTPKLNVYQLEYEKRSKKWQKLRSYFYRPEFVADDELWKELRNGNGVITQSDVLSNEERDKQRILKRKAEARSKYK